MGARRVNGASLAFPLAARAMRQYDGMTTLPHGCFYVCIPSLFFLPFFMFVWKIGTLGGLCPPGFEFDFGLTGHGSTVASGQVGWRTEYARSSQQDGSRWRSVSVSKTIKKSPL